MKTIITSVFSAVMTMLIFVGCNKGTIVSNESNTTDVNVQFKLNINSGTNRTRSAADLSEIDAAKFVIVAYKQTENGTYSFEKATDSSSNTFDKDNETLSNENFNLPVGTYRFLAIYNVGGNTTFRYNQGSEKNWSDILSSAQIFRNDQNLDVNEIFAFESVKDENLSSQGGKVNISMELNRVNSRIDVIVKKIYKGEDGEVEVGYKPGHDVLGGADNIASVKTATDVTTTNWTFSSVATTSSSVFYGFTDTEKQHIIVGTSNKITPPITADNINVIDEQMIKRGTCYYQGAYVLPFIENSISDGGTATSTESSTVTLVFTNGQNQERTIIVPDVPAKENHISLITVKLITLKDPGEGGDDGDDGENIFNPNVQYTITISEEWAGVDNTDVEI